MELPNQPITTEHLIKVKQPDNSIIEVPVRLPWKAICNLACKAFVEGVSLDQMMNYYLASYQHREYKRKLKLKTEL